MAEDDTDTGPLATARALVSVVSPMTRVILAAYLLYVPAAWIVGTAPGEHEYEGARLSEPAEPLADVTVVHRVADDLLVAETGGGPLRMVDLSRAATGPLPDAIVASPRVPGAVRSAVRREGIVHLLTETEDGARMLATVPLDGSPADVEEADPSSLWPLADGTAMGHGLTDFLVYDTWQLHPSGRPAEVSGPLVLVRLAHQRPDASGEWQVLPGSARDDIMLLDSDDAEPLGWMETLRTGTVSPAPAVPGFLTLISEYPGVVLCDDEGCREERLHIRDDSHTAVLHLDHRDAVDRMAACTATELYLYQGHPLQEDVVYLGHTALPGPCRSMAIVDERRVLVTFEALPPRLVRFEEDADG